jgi:hypothetical protein
VFLVGVVEKFGDRFLIACAGYLCNAIAVFLGVWYSFSALRLALSRWRNVRDYVSIILFSRARSHFPAALLPFIITHLLYGRHP